MKYMGSKRAMLQNGLGKLLEAEVRNADRFVDLFSGSGSVAIHVARLYSLGVWAFDLQEYGSVLAGAVLHRRGSLRWEPVWQRWFTRAEALFASRRLPNLPKVTKASVKDVRAWCTEQTGLPITKAYGGHYYSPEQAVWIDALRASLPSRDPAKTTALAALIQAASQCAAAPGHTAQPFQPTASARRYIEEAWDKDVASRTRAALETLAKQYATRPSWATVSDANAAARTLRAGDLAFIDPPYSGVQYSRFYHVLETVALGKCGPVSGVGRYPAAGLRPRSKYSMKTESFAALDDLLGAVASRGARAILTFPDHDCSNGLSGEAVRTIAGKYSRIRERHVESVFSTMGGTGQPRQDESARAARQSAKELMLVLDPR